MDARHKAGHETKGKRIVTTNGASLAAPLGLLAELTHRCPARLSPIVPNPLALDKRDDELDTATWGRVFREAAALGVLQVHLSGGEPAAQRDLPELVKAAREAGLYNNLITSAVGLTSQNLAVLADAVASITCKFPSRTVTRPPPIILPATKALPHETWVAVRSRQARAAADHQYGCASRQYCAR